MSDTQKIDIGQLLDEKIPRDVVSTRDGGGGRKLSYLEGHYVIDRLNKIFGHLNWSVEITDVRQVTNTTAKGDFPAYLVKVRLTAEGQGNTIVKEAYGYGADKSGLNAHELAIKEARTDALKVAAKDLGMSMGLALYDKTQENVSDEEPQSKPNSRQVAPRAVEQSQPRKSVSISEIPDAAPKSAPQSTITETNTSDLQETIRSYVKVAEKQKKFTTQDYKNRLNINYGVLVLKELQPDQLRAELDYVKQVTAS